MEKVKKMFSRNKILCLALVLVLVSAGLIGGVTYARYQWEMMQASYYFTPENTAVLSVYADHITPDMTQYGVLPEPARTWSLTGSGETYSFSVANGSTGEFLQQDRVFTLSIAAGLTVEDPEKLSVVLTYTDPEGNLQTVAGVPVAIQTGTFQYDAFGDGWIYEFRTRQDELRFSLTGGSFDYQNFTVTVTGNVPVTLLDLQVTQVPET